MPRPKLTDAEREDKRVKHMAYMVAYRIANREKILADKKAKHAANRTENNRKASDNYRRYYAEKKDAIKQSKREQYAADPQKAAAKTQQWKLKNPEKAKQSSVESQKRTLPVRRAREANRRARKLDAGGSLSKGLAKKLLALQKNCCACCKASLADGYHMDHIVPLAQGGANVDNNIQLLTPACNLRKRSRDPLEYMQAKGFLI